MNKEPIIEVMLDVGFLVETVKIPISQLFKNGFYGNRYTGYRFNGKTYFFGKKIAFKDIPDIPKNKILLNNMRRNDWNFVVITRCGNVQPVLEGDVVIPLNEDYIDIITESVLEGKKHELPTFKECSL